MYKRLVIFDLDGTLLDTIADLATAANHALRVCGYPVHSVETLRTFVGNGIGKLLERSLPLVERTGENVERLRAEFIPYYNEHNTDLSVPYPGVPALLGQIAACGVMLAVASNKYQTATEKLVKYYFPEIPFAKVYGQRDGIPVKPNPAVVHDIMASAGVAAESVLYVGDSGVDMQTAINAGVDAVAVSWGFRPRSELEAFRPLAVVDSAGEILRYIQSR